MLMSKCEPALTSSSQSQQIVERVMCDKGPVKGYLSKTQIGNLNNNGDNRRLGLKEQLLNIGIIPRVTHLNCKLFLDHMWTIL